MIPPDKLRALLADHAPRAYYDREQGAIRDVWDAAREMLALLERLGAITTGTRPPT